MRSLLMLLVIGATLCSFNMPYPIPARPLRMLIMESQVIIEGEVIGEHILMEKDKKGREYEGAHIAVIRVKNLLQGKLDTDTVQVFFEPNMICPAPASYSVNTAVITFLDKRPDGQGYYTHALSYGVKQLPREGLDIYKKRIREMQAIMQLKDTVQQRNKIMDWLVACAENKFTRWEGIYELSGGSSFSRMELITQEKEVRDPLTDRSLNKQQKKTLFNLISKDTVRSEDFPLIDLVIADYKEPILQLMVHTIKNSGTDNRGDPWFAYGLMHRIKDIKRDERLSKLIAEYDKLMWSTDNNVGQLQQEKVKDFIALL